MLMTDAPLSTAQRSARSACTRVDCEAAGAPPPSHTEAEAMSASGATPTGPLPVPLPAMTPATAVPWWMIDSSPTGSVPSRPVPEKSWAAVTRPVRFSCWSLTPESMTATVTPSPRDVSQRSGIPYGSMNHWPGPGSCALSSRSPASGGAASALGVAAWAAPR
jgi:hypothetical protein